MSDKQRMIVIASHGWVYVGLVYRDGDQIVITECSNVRRWGTTSGLGELALEGPKDGTQLDYYGTVKIHVLALCGTIECNEEVWSKHRAAPPAAQRRSRS